MKKNAEVTISFLYRLLNAVIFSGIVILHLSDSFGITAAAWKHWIVLLLTTVLFLMVKELNKRQQIYVFILGILILTMFYRIIGRGIFTEWFSEEKIFVWTFVIAVSSCILQFVFEKYFVLKAVSAFIMCGLLLYALFAKQPEPKMEVALSLLYAVMTLTEYIRINMKKTMNKNLHAFILWVSPFLALYFGLLCLLPAPDAPYSWQWLKNIYLNAEEKVTMYVENLMNRQREDLDDAVSGFSEGASLFSNIADSNKDMMIIKSTGGKNQYLYLTGKVYDSFDGREWKSLNEGSRQERLLDTLETVYALEKYAIESEERSAYYYNSIHMEVAYRFFHTAYLMAPSKTWATEGKGKTLRYCQSGADFVFDEKAGYGTEYFVDFCQMNMSRDKMQDFLHSDLEDDEELWDKTVKRYAEEEIPLTELDTYRADMRKQYLSGTAASYEADPEIEEWILNVTKDASDSEERLFCIEAALSEMEYNTNPGKLPEYVTDEQSFLKYFLLEKQEGYCSYFATAFVLLARAEGFPARYVQGFCVTAGGGRETIVYSNMAHAWPEVYIEGRGWIPFEPTPGYVSARYAADEENSDRKDDAINAGIQTEPLTENISIDEDYSNGQDEADSEDANEQIRWFALILRVVLIVFAIAVFALIVDRLSEKYREKRRGLSEKYSIAVLRNLQILSMLGYDREESETYDELMKRIIFEPDEKRDLVEFIETYESILYGTRQAGKRELEECLSQRDRLLEILRNNKGGKYFLYRLKLYLM